jgi:hypothetical protein
MRDVRAVRIDERLHDVENRLNALQHAISRSIGDGADAYDAHRSDHKSREQKARRWEDIQGKVMTVAITSATASLIAFAKPLVKWLLSWLA